MEYNERKIQAVLMNWLLTEKNHDISLTNPTSLFPWEADLVSVTKAGYSHEFEIKTSQADFLKDKRKRFKHSSLKDPENYPGFLRPNYFWYVTPKEIKISAPDYAGWIVINGLLVEIKKEAPRIHTQKIDTRTTLKIAHLLSFRLMSELKASLYKTP